MPAAFVARHLNAQLLVEMRPMSDLEAIIDIENRQRVDICEAWGRDVLMPAAHGRKTRRPARDEVVKDQMQRPLFRIRRGSRSVAFTSQIDQATPSVLEEMRQAVANVMRKANSPQSVSY